MSLLEVGTALRLERDASSMVKSLRQATNDYAFSPLHAYGDIMHRFSLPTGILCTYSREVEPKI